MSQPKPGLRYEQEFRLEGKLAVAGLDEAGRGAWAGPVSAGAVILPLERYDLLAALEGVRDSKLCTPRQRVRLDAIIRIEADAFGVGLASPDEIDTIGIAPATRLAMRRALDALPTQPDALLIDYVRLRDIELPQKSFPKGERLSLSVAAASIVAKVARDRLMVELDREYPNYGFALHKGYGTARHQQALLEHGPCPIHRFSFAPLRLQLNRATDEYHARP